MNVVVVGAGIGGLAAAVALSRAGHEVVVCERARELREVGAGVQLSPNAARLLETWGLGTRLWDLAVQPQRIVIRRWRDDEVLRAMPLGEAFTQRYGCPYANIHRHDLVTVLAEALAGVSGVSLRLGVEVTGVEVTGVRLADGSTIRADVVVGADGIHSVIRASLFGPTPSRFSGAVAYRALIPRALVADLPIEVNNRLGPDSHVVTYFIGRDARLLNLVCVVPEPNWDVESWTEPGSVEELRAAFTDWSPELRRLLDLVEAPVFRWALHDREPLSEWGSGAVTLLGDACHPMLPFMAQGACQAIEDAAVLAACLDDDVETSLRRYEAARRPRATKVQSLSWRNRETYHLADGPLQERRDTAYAELGDDLTSFDWLYGHDVSNV